jgi:hypothetical protein
VRVVRIAFASFLGLAGALIGAPAAVAAGATIRLDPAHGTARASFSVVYRYVSAGARFCPVERTRVVIAWDGNAVGQTQLNRETCSVEMRLRPPRNDRAAGQHRVTARMPFVLGSRAETVYTIDDGTAPSPTAMPPDTGEPTSTPAMTDSALAGDSAAAGDGTAVTGTAAADTRPAWVGWALVYGAALVLAGAGTLGMVIVRARRERDGFD